MQAFEEYGYKSHELQTLHPKHLTLNPYSHTQHTAIAQRATETHPKPTPYTLNAQLHN